jgi:hypothetical protein
MGHERARRIQRPGNQLVVQAKLTVGRAGDPAEHEADRAAQHALTQIGSPAQISHGGGGAADALGGLRVDSGIEQRINRARSSGSALDNSTLDTMSPALGRDFSDVRVHTGGEADQLNRSLQARAFTTGNDIFFSKGAYAPQSKSGSSLLAHELAHVVQQDGGVQRSTVMRSFDPKNPNIASVTAATRLSGGLANKGVFLLAGENGAEIVAKFIDEDPRRAQMADVVLSTSGVGSSGAEPYGMDVGRQITAAVRALAVQKRLSGDEDGARYLEDGANKADNGANGVVLMAKMGGSDLADILIGGNKTANDDEKAKGAQSGVDPVALLSQPQFHYNLGRMYVADGLLGSADRLVHEGDKIGARLNGKNLKVLADGTINTFDSDTVIIAYDTLQASAAKDKSAAAWTKWLINGGRVMDLGIQAPGAYTQDLVTMFDVKVREDIFKEVKASFTSMADALDWSTNTLDFATFDPSFRRGIVDALTTMVAQMDRLVATAKTIGGADQGAGAIDSDAMGIKAAYLRTVLPDLAATGTVGDDTKASAKANATRQAEKIVARKDLEKRARSLSAFDMSLLPVPVREQQMGNPKKVGRKVARLVGSIGGSSSKSKDSKRAKALRKGSDLMDQPGTADALEEVKAMGGGSHRKTRAQFDLGMKNAVLILHHRANELGNADFDIMKLQTAVSNPNAVREQLDPYVKLINDGTYKAAVDNFKLLADGYSNQLTRKGDDALAKEVTRARTELDDQSQGFEASVDFIERSMRKRARV